MKVGLVLCIASVGAIHLNGSPGSIAGSAGDLTTSGATSGASGITGAGVSASAGLMGTLKSLIGEISSANAASIAAGSSGSAGGSIAASAGGASSAGGAGSPEFSGNSAEGGLLSPPAASSSESSARGKFVQGQMMHMAAANPMETSEEVEVEQAIRSAMSSPSKMGTYSSLSNELSRGYTSFLKFDSGSYIAGAKMSPDTIAAIWSQVEAQTSQFLTRASSCGTCPHGVNYGSCPAGFTEARSGECTPSPSYKGFCSRPVDISGFSEVEKEEMEISCDTCFKCL